MQFRSHTDGISGKPRTPFKCITLFHFEISRLSGKAKKGGTVDSTTGKVCNDLQNYCMLSKDSDTNFGYSREYYNEKTDSDAAEYNNFQVPGDEEIVHG